MNKNSPNKKNKDSKPSSSQPKKIGGIPIPALSFSAGAKSVLGKLGTVLASLFMVCVITGCIVVCVLTVYILQYIGTDSGIDLNTVELSYTTIFYAIDPETGEEQELQRMHGAENRIPVTTDQISENFVKAAIAGEDARFRTHQGVDWKRTTGSFINQFIPIYKIKSGGSTITQQLIKNATGDNAQRIDRKVREIFRALNMEKYYSKEEIMTAYLNTIGLGGNTAGVEAAANLYFNKSAADVTVAEAAAIIAITKSPTFYNPLINPDNNKVRRDYIIENMYELGEITEEEYNVAIAEELVFNTEGAGTKLNTDYSWYIDHVIEEVIADLVEQKGYTYQYAESQLMKGGYRIYTTVDKEMQDYLYEKYKTLETFPKIKNAEYPQSAFVITDLSGKILALAGGRGEKETNRAFNRATQAKRQPGSTMKPMASYPVAFENDIITWSTMFEDRPVYRAGQAGFDKDWPRNHYGSYLPNPITVDEAIRRSTNTVPAQLTEILGPQLIFGFMKNTLKIESLVEERVVKNKVYTDITMSGMALGSLTDGMTPLEVAGAYQMIGNGGMMTKPYAYTTVLDSVGNVVLEKDTTPVRVISAETATLLNRLLQRSTTAQYGTGTASVFRRDIPVAGKTGTSDWDYNQWFAGMTPYYLGVCWLGYDTPETIAYYQYPPPIIWNTVMAGIHGNLPAKDFNYSGKVISRAYCTESGLLLSDSCTTSGQGWYKDTNLPATCDVCSGTIDSDDLGEGYDDDDY